MFNFFSSCAHALVLRIVAAPRQPHAACLVFRVAAQRVQCRACSAQTRPSHTEWHELLEVDPPRGARVPPVGRMHDSMSGVSVTVCVLLPLLIAAKVKA